MTTANIAYNNNIELSWPARRIKPAIARQTTVQEVIRADAQKIALCVHMVENQSMAIDRYFRNRL